MTDKIIFSNITMKLNQLSKRILNITWVLLAEIVIFSAMYRFSMDLSIPSREGFYWGQAEMYEVSYVLFVGYMLLIKSCLCIMMYNSMAIKAKWEISRIYRNSTSFFRITSIIFFFVGIIGSFIEFEMYVVIIGICLSYFATAITLIFIFKERTQYLSPALALVSLLMVIISSIYL